MLLVLWCRWIRPHRLPGSAFAHLGEPGTAVVASAPREVVQWRDEGEIVTVEQPIPVCRVDGS